MTEQLKTLTRGCCDQPRNMVVLLHGMASNAQDMSDIADFFARDLPETCLVIPEARKHLQLSDQVIERMQQNNPEFEPDHAKSWFEISKWLPLSLKFNRLQAIHDLNQLIDAHLSAHGLSNKDLALFGFSQGGFLALYTAMSRDEPCGAVINHSGPFFGFANAHAQPDTLLLYGEEEVKSIENMHDKLKDHSMFKRMFAQIPYWLYSPEHTYRRLTKYGVNVDYQSVPGLTHSMNEDSLNRAKQFLQHKMF